MDAPAAQGLEDAERLVHEEVKPTSVVKPFTIRRHGVVPLFAAVDRRIEWAAVRCPGRQTGPADRSLVEHDHAEPVFACLKRCKDPREPRANDNNVSGIAAAGRTRHRLDTSVVEHGGQGQCCRSDRAYLDRVAPRDPGGFRLITVISHWAPPLSLAAKGLREVPSSLACCPVRLFSAGSSLLARHHNQPKARKSARLRSQLLNDGS